MLDLLFEFLGTLLAGFGGGTGKETPGVFGVLFLAGAAVTLIGWFLFARGPLTFEAACYVGGAAVIGVALLVWHWITEPIRKAQR